MAALRLCCAWEPIAASRNCIARCRVTRLGAHGATRCHINARRCITAQPLIGTMMRRGFSRQGGTMHTGAALVAAARLSATVRARRAVRHLLRHLAQRHICIRVARSRVRPNTGPHSIRRRANFSQISR